MHIRPIFARIARMLAHARPLPHACRSARADSASGARRRRRRTRASRKSIVTGTYIRRKSQFDSPSPLVTLSADDLAANGANEIGA